MINVAETLGENAVAFDLISQKLIILHFISLSLNLKHTNTLHLLLLSSVAMVSGQLPFNSHCRDQSFCSDDREFYLLTYTLLYGKCPI